MPAALAKALANRNLSDMSSDPKSPYKKEILALIRTNGKIA